MKIIMSEMKNTLDKIIGRLAIWLPRWLSGKESACSAEDLRLKSSPWVGKTLWRSLIGYSPWGHKESDMTEQLSSRMQPLQTWS